MATGTTAEQIIDVVTPAAGESVSEGTVLEWRVKVGEFIKADDTIVEISTDKVDVELPAPASGTVSELLAQEGDTVTVGQVIARIAVGAEDGAAARTTDGGNGAQATAAGPRQASAPTTASAPTAAAPPAAAPTAASPSTTTSPPAGAPDGGAPPADLKISPVAARAAAVEGVDLAQVEGS